MTITEKNNAKLIPLVTLVRNEEDGMRNLLRKLFGKAKSIESGSIDCAFEMTKAIKSDPIERVSTKSIEFDIFQFVRRVMLIALGCMVVFAPVQAASFDCAKAASKVENLICDTPVVSKLDDELGKAYKDSIKKANEEQKQRLVSDQKKWLKQSRNICNDESCFKHAYTFRIEELKSFFEPKSALSEKDERKTEQTIQGQNEASQSLKPTAAPLETVQKLLNFQIKLLKEKQNNAHDVLFFDGDKPKDKSGYCERFWHALKAQSAFDIPQPAMIAATHQEKERLFETLYNNGKSNFDRYMLQGGKLTPNEYTDIQGQRWELGHTLKSLPRYLKKLPEEFDKLWQRDTDSHGFFDKNDLLDQNITMHILYLQPYPVAGYVHPLLITLAKDQCDNCTDISMGVHIIAVDGLPQPDWMNAKYFSQANYSEAYKQSFKRNVSRPIGPYQHMGLGIFNGEFIFWTLNLNIA